MNDSITVDLTDEINLAYDVFDEVPGESWRTWGYRQAGDDYMDD
jgi:hypothetical protein